MACSQLQWSTEILLSTFLSSTYCFIPAPNSNRYSLENHSPLQPGNEVCNCRPFPFPPPLQSHSHGLIPISVARHLLHPPLPLCPHLQKITLIFSSNLFIHSSCYPSPNSNKHFLVILKPTLPEKQVDHQSRYTGFRSSLSLLSSKSNPLIPPPAMKQNTRCGLFSVSVPIPKGLS